MPYLLLYLFVEQCGSKLQRDQSDCVLMLESDAQEQIVSYLC